MAKRKAKADRDQEQFTALYQRIEDICLGAYGYPPDRDFPFDAATLRRIITGCRSAFELFGEHDEKQMSKNSHLFSVCSLEHYDSVDSIADYLFANGIRASQ